MTPGVVSRKALTAVGQAVHAAPMSAFDPVRYARAERLLMLASTYGDGDAPASATDFLDRLAPLPAPPSAPLAVLGFGDSGFPAFCGFASAVASAAEAKGWVTLLPTDSVDRQSLQDFARKGHRRDVHGSRCLVHSVDGSLDGATIARRMTLDALFLDREGDHLRQSLVGQLFEPCPLAHCIARKYSPNERLSC